MHGQWRVTAWCGHLVLFAALLLGLVTMHTFGHPSDSGSPHAAHASAAGAVYEPPDDTAPAPRAAPSQNAKDAAPLIGQPAQHASHASANASAPLPDGGMDPLSACLAVLGTWTVVLLLAAGFLPNRSADLLAAATARLSPARWPIPPPRRRVALAQLSVLRI